MTDDDERRPDGAGMIPTTPPPGSVLDNIRQMYASLPKVAPWQSKYESPDEPRDRKMAAQLMSTFVTEGNAEIREPLPHERAAMELTGLPVEEIARSVNVQWRQRLADLVERTKAAGAFGTEADWLIVCSDHLFENWDRVCSISVQHSAHMPPWSLFMVRSNSWWEGQSHGAVRIDDAAFGAVDPGGAKVIPFPAPRQGA